MFTKQHQLTVFTISKYTKFISILQGVAPKRNVFLGKTFADPTIKKSTFYPASISIKKPTPGQKGYHPVVTLIDLHIVLTYYC
jgi:hypothetical protein